jgi:hypothetical protein
LPPDDFESSDGHARLLHLIDGTPRFDCMMLSLVAEKDDGLDTSMARTVQKSVHLTCRKETGFIHDPQFLLGGRRRWILHKACNSASAYARF